MMEMCYCQTLLFDYSAFRCFRVYDVHLSSFYALVSVQVHSVLKLSEFSVKIKEMRELKYLLVLKQNKK